MREIKVGEYVRCKNGKLSKVSDINIENTIMYFDKEIYRKDGVPIFQLEKVFIDFITKHSFNIIDLIEENDYVNGKLIHKVDIRNNSAYIYYGNGKTFTDYQIKSVVTKEQFASVEYKVGGKNERN